MMLSNLATKPTRILSVQTELKEKRILFKIVTLHCGLLNPITKFTKKYALNVKTESEWVQADLLSLVLPLR